MLKVNFIAVPRQCDSIRAEGCQDVDSVTAASFGGPIIFTTITAIATSKVTNSTIAVTTATTATARATATAAHQALIAILIYSAATVGSLRTTPSPELQQAV